MTDLKTGLTQAQVVAHLSKVRSMSQLLQLVERPKEIILHNTLTLFNFLNLLLFCMVLFTGSLKESAVYFIRGVNTGIGIYQEVKQRKQIEAFLF